SKRDWSSDVCSSDLLSQNLLRFRTEIQYPQIHPEFLSKTGQNHESEHFCPPSPPSPPSHQQMDFCQDFGHIKSRLHTMKRTDREHSATGHSVHEAARGIYLCRLHRIPDRRHRCGYVRKTVDVYLACPYQQ